MRLKPLHLEQSPRRIFTDSAGLALLGEAIRVAQLEAAVASLGPYRGAGYAEVLTTYLGLLTLGKSDFEAAEGARSGPFLLAALSLKRSISAARLRQRLDAFAMTRKQGVCYTYRASTGTGRGPSKACSTASPAYSVR
jgi:hypothetical protein